MSRLSAPRVAGVAGGVGTTTLATVLRAHDRGRDIEQGLDVLACRCTGDSLQQAAGIVSKIAAAELPRPVLAVTADVPTPPRGPLRARLRMIEPQVSGLVVLPYVARWRELSDPLAEATSLLETPLEQLPRALRDYVVAVRALAAAVVSSGQLAAAAAQPQRAQPHPRPQPPQAQPRQAQPRQAHRETRYVPYGVPAPSQRPARARRPRLATNGGRP
jgi:hypothetical protein